MSPFSSEDADAIETRKNGAEGAAQRFNPAFARPRRASL